MEKFPTLINTQVALSRADTRTGYVLDEMLEFAINEEQKVYTVLNNYYEALAFAKAAMEVEKNVEYIIHGKNQELLFYLSPAVTNAFNSDFCVELEYHLCRTFENSADSDISRLGCDGVIMPDYGQTMKQVNETKTIVTGAWIGTTGEYKYEMTVRLGDCSIDKLKNGQSLSGCLPDEESLDWISIDILGKKIELRLK